MGTDVTDAFERWETNILEVEMEVGSAEQVDALEQQFIDAENRETLRFELQQLLAEEYKNHD